MSGLPDTSFGLADALNAHCACRTVDAERLRGELAANDGAGGFADRWPLTHPHLFSRSPVFVDEAVAATIAHAVRAIERVAALPAYRDAALARAPDSNIARLDFGPAGAFMGYDFHVGADGPRLIEINTNAGGALLAAALTRAHRDCWAPMRGGMDASTGISTLDEVFVAMFRSEWRAQRGDAPLQSVLIVDDAPAAQYLAPEFEMARALFERHGIRAAIADARDLRWDGIALRHPALPDGLPVDLVYNRCTDFALAEPSHAALRRAYVAGAAVVTPHPRAHALHADKRNLHALSDDASLAAWGIGEDDRRLLRAVVPRTVPVASSDTDALWSKRRRLFFKPAGGFGAKAVYRGDKLTRRVWADILAGDYVAQTLVPASERLVDVDGVATRLKLDLRAYTYRGHVQLLAARTWAGQVTNFRTEGGGFSPVTVLPASTRVVGTGFTAPRTDCGSNGECGSGDDVCTTPAASAS